MMPPRSQWTSSGQEHRSLLVVPIGLLAAGVWGTLAPWVGRWVGLEVPVPTSVEIVDHVVPGVVVLAIAAAGLAGRLPLAAALAALLAGAWITLTHAPLLVEALGDAVDLAAALFHSLPGVLVVAFAAVATVRGWRQEDASSRRSR